MTAVNGKGEPIADPLQAVPVGRTKREREMLATIEDQIQHLTDKIEAPGMTNGASGWLRSRRAAYRWSLVRIAEAEQYENEIDALKTANARLTERLRATENSLDLAAQGVKPW